MGVPKFYRWISERYPCLSEVIKEYQIPEFDNLYLDMNGIIHVCSHPNDDDPHFRITEEKIFADICHYLDFLLKMIKPQKVFFMAVDGVAPRAKMNQQRGRRFRTARTAEILEQKAKASGEVLPKEARFDSNCITPGTVFMAKLHEILKSFISYKISTDKLWQNIRIYLSGHETPGEGEHKVMDFIRYEKSQNNYDPNTRHCLYGLDADLIMLGLSSHEPHFSLLREEVRFGKKENQKRIVCPEEMTFHLLHLSLLREYLGHEFSPVRDSIKFEFDMEKIIDDFVLMSFLVGNDFIPNLPQLHIRHNALPILYKTYIEVLPNLGGYINEGGNLHLERFQMFFEKLSEYDYEKFGESSEFPPPGNRSKVDQEEDKFQGFERLVDLGFSALSLEKTTEYDSSSEDDSDGALFELEFSQHKMDYYRNKLEYENVTQDVLRDQAEGYVRAIQWNLHYYYNGIASWSWYYPHHYAPYISDVKNFKTMEIKFDIGEPFAPFQQLLAVLPVLSKNLLPPSYQDLMTNDDSPLKDYYPEDFETDLNGKQQDWEAVVLIPFINEKLLLKCAREADRKMNADERKRNQHGPHLLYTYTEQSSGSFESFLPKYFPPLEANHSKHQFLDLNTFRLPADSLLKGLCPGVFLDVHFPGFPTLKHICHTAKLSHEEVKVFQMSSQRDSMMLTITEPVDTDINHVAKCLVGQSTYINWPHLQEGFVMGVSSEEFTYTWDGEKMVKTTTNLPIWCSQLKSVREYYHKRLGIFIGDLEVPILVHAKSLIGSRVVCSNDGQIEEQKQWTQSESHHVLQTTVKNIIVPETEKSLVKSYSDLFAVGSVVFMLGQPHYGCMGTIINNDPKRKIKQIAVKLEIVKEPDLKSVIRDKEKFVSMRYKPGYEMAKSLGISGNFLARITGTFLVQTNSKESISPNVVNVGLNLKFNRKNEEVAGYSKKNEHNEWVYSEQVKNTLNSYICQFPDFFDKIIPFAKRDMLYLEDIYPEGGGADVVSQIVKWLKTQQCFSAERQLCGRNTLDQGVVSAIESLVSRNASNNIEYHTVNEKPEFLYNSLFCKGCVLPDPNSTFEIFDRVVNVRFNLTVPPGLRGTIIGIKTADRICDYIYEVVFDKEFFGGLTLHSSPRRGYRMPPSALLNISHGERLSKPKALPHEKTSYGNTFSPSSQFRRYNDSGTASKNTRNQLTGNSPVMIMKNNTKQQVPFYKTDSFAFAQSASGNNSGSFSASAAAAHNPQQHEFVTPKVSQAYGTRNSFGASKASNSEIVHDDNFHNIWNDLITKSSADSSPKKKPEIFGKTVTVEELFSAVDKHNSKNMPMSHHPQQSNHAVPSAKSSAVLDLMNHCLNVYGNPPTYSYQEVGMTGCYISSVTLPEGQTHVSAQCPSQVEASENAAEKALVILKQKLPQGYMTAGGVPGNPNFRTDMPFRPAVFPNMPMDMRPRLLLPPSLPFPPPQAPYTYGLPLARYPSIPVQIIPDSFVKQNQMLLAGQVPVQQFLQPTNLAQTVIQRPTLPPSLCLKDDKKDSAIRENVFVPLQVLKHTTKKPAEEHQNVLGERDWPSLPPSFQTSCPRGADASNNFRKGRNAAESDRVKSTVQSPHSSGAASASMVREPRQRKKRLAAVFSNM